MKKQAYQRVPNRERKVQLHSAARYRDIAFSAARALAVGALSINKYK